MSREIEIIYPPDAISFSECKNCPKCGGVEMKIEYMGEIKSVINQPETIEFRYSYPDAPNRKELLLEALSVVCVACKYKRIVKPKDAPSQVLSDERE